MMETLADYAGEFARLSELLDKGLGALRTEAVKEAVAESVYRQAKSEAWLLCPNDDPGTKAADREWQAARREAWVNSGTSEQRQARDVARAMTKAALEAVRSRRTQVSALQSMLNARREEMAFDRTGPRLDP